MKELLRKIMRRVIRHGMRVLHRLAMWNDAIEPWTFDEARVRENAKKYGTLSCRVGRRIIEVPVRNEFGHCYPAYATDVVDRLFEIKSEDLVVDVGGGGNPLKRANLVVDLFPADTTHRGVPLKLYPHQRFVQADVENMHDVFKDKSVDFLFSQQTFEHLDHPDVACEEIMRVAKRGFLDVPRMATDLHIGHREHKWLIDWVDGVLVFRRKPVINQGSPIFGLHPLLAFYNDDRVGLWLEYYYRNISCVQLLWADRFRYKIIE